MNISLKYSMSFYTLTRTFTMLFAKGNSRPQTLLLAQQEMTDQMNSIECKYGWGGKL